MPGRHRRSNETLRGTDSEHKLRWYQQVAKLGKGVIAGVVLTGIVAGGAAANAAGGSNERGTFHEASIDSDTPDGSEGQNPGDYGGGETPEEPLEGLTEENFPIFIKGEDGKYTEYIGIEELTKAHGIPANVYDPNSESPHIDMYEPTNGLIRVANMLNDFEFAPIQDKALEDHMTDNYNEDNVFRNTVAPMILSMVFKDSEKESKLYKYILNNACQSLKDRRTDDKYHPFYKIKLKPNVIEEKSYRDIIELHEGSWSIDYIKDPESYFKGDDSYKAERTYEEYVNELKYWTISGDNADGNKDPRDNSDGLWRFYDTSISP